MLQLFFSVQAVKSCSLSNIGSLGIFCQKLLPAQLDDDNVFGNNQRTNHHSAFLNNNIDNEHSASVELIDLVFVVCRFVDKRLEVRRKAARQSNVATAAATEAAAANHLHGPTRCRKVGQRRRSHQST
jgi:hypothetical protein